LYSNLMIFPNKTPRHCYLGEIHKTNKVEFVCLKM